MDYGRVKANQWEEFRRHKNEDEDLLIFGYSCKLFRDDEKAMFIENGEHLIPWMGDPNLMIDRFDVRGALYDLKEAENKGKPFEETANEVELKEEQICDQERYLALYHDENQLQVTIEEEAKRLQVELAADGSEYNQVAFDYTPPNQVEAMQHLPVRAAQTYPVPEAISYNPSSDEDIFLPPPQLNIPMGMEIPTSVKQNKIIVKTAKFIVTQGAQMEIVIKTKQAGNPMFNFLAFDNPLNAYYKHVVNMIRNGRYRWEEEPEGNASKNDQYLHPNLSQSVRPDLTPGVIPSPAKPSPHCAYSKLITKIREKQIASTLEDTEIPSPIAPSSPATIVPVPVQDPQQTPTSHRSTEPIVGLVDYPSFNQTADGLSDVEESEPVCNKKSASKVIHPRSHSHDYRNIKWPPPELQMVIDKMASYIIKNGTAFEEVVRNRGDPRFEFLKESHEYFPYYQCKYELYNEVYGDIFKHISKPQEWKKKNSSNISKKDSQHLKSCDGSRTISFSIKSRDQEVSLTSHTTFPIESSTSEEDDDMDEEEKERRKAERDERRQARRNKEEKERREREEHLKKEKQRKEREEEERRKMEKMVDDDSSGNEDLYDIFKYAQEMERDKSNNGHADSPDECSSYSKQEERKKKAAAFLSKLKETKVEKREPKEEKNPPIYGPQMPPEIAVSLSRTATLSPPSSRVSSDGEKPPPLPPPSDHYQPPPPPPKSPSPLGMSDCLLYNLIEMGKMHGREADISREASSSPKRKRSTKESSNSMASMLLAGFHEDVGEKRSRGGVSESVETSNHKSRSHKKRSRQKSESRSPSRRDKKKRKRSHGYRRKKRRSRSRSRSRGHSKSQRSSHKKKQSKHSSHREKEKARKKKHKRHRSPSSASSLPSSDSSSRCTPSTLPSESEESDMDVQVIESHDEAKRSSRGSSIVSLPSSNPRNSIPTNSSICFISTSDSMIGEKVAAKNEGSVSGGEESSSLSSAPLFKHSALPLFHADENTNSSLELNIETEKKSLFNPNTSSAMAKIAQGLRAKLNALLEKENKLE